MDVRDILFAITAIALAASLMVLSAGYLDLQSRYQTLSAIHAELDASHKSLLENYSKLADDYWELDRKFSSLSSEYQDLVKENRIIAAENQELRSSYLKLNTSHVELIEAHRELQARYADLEDEYRALNQRFSEIESELETMSLRVLLSGEVFKLVLSQPIDEKVSRLVRQELGLDPASPPSAKAVRIFEWITLNMQYVMDQRHPYYLRGMIDYLDEYLKPANETLAVGGGDCEDLALLTYAMLRPVIGEGEEAYLIVLENPWMRHVAVLYGSGGLYSIIDPAGSYITDTMAVLEVTMLQIESRELMKFHLVPIKLSPSIKSHFIKMGFMELKYIDSRDGSPKIPGEFLDIEDATYSWISHWAADMPDAYVSMLVNETHVQSFSSTSEFIEWIRG